MKTSTSTPAITRSPVAYAYCKGLRRSDADEYNPAAHGGCAYREDRGHEYRTVNVNGDHEEVGPWRVKF